MKDRTQRIPKTIPNPAYLESPEYIAKLEKAKGRLASWDCVEDYFPEDAGKKLPEKGAWIMLLQTLKLGKELPDNKFESVVLPHLSIWYALPALVQSVPHNAYIPRRSKAVVQTPQGEVHVWPHEYQIIDIAKYLQFTEKDGFYIHFLHPETGGFDPDKLFYLRSRGIDLATAQRALLPELNNPHFCYFTFHEEYSKTFGEGAGIPYIICRDSSYETKDHHPRKARKALWPQTTDLRPAADHASD